MAALDPTSQAARDVIARQEAYALYERHLCCFIALYCETSVKLKRKVTTESIRVAMDAHRRRWRCLVSR